jgi:hypothetical protein
MDNTLLNFALEIGLFSLLGVLYYFYQKRKILKYEENKTPLVISFILQSCLSEKLDTAQPELDHVIEALDDFLKQESSHPPVSLLKTFAQTSECSPELKEVILEGLKELEL